MSDLVTLVVIGALLGVMLAIGVVVVSLRKRDHQRQEAGAEREDHAADERR